MVANSRPTFAAIAITSALFFFVRPAIAQRIPPILCGSMVVHYRNGAPVDSLCETYALSQGLTVLNLGDSWVPFGLRGGDGIAAPDYRSTYLALARQDSSAITDVRSRGLGFYGIFPTLSLLRQRLEEKDRYQCHMALPAELTAFPRKRMVEENTVVGRERVRNDARQRSALEFQMRRRDLPSLEVLASQNAYFKRQVEKLEKREARSQVIRIVQKHLLCESAISGISKVTVNGILSWRTTRALRIFQRQHFLPPNGWIDEATFQGIQAPQAHNNRLDALRILRERVVDATGLIEDGSAVNKVNPVFEHVLDPLGLVWPLGYSASAKGESDRIGAATDRAARHLGWRDAQSVVQFIERYSPAGSGPLKLKVAVELPPLPSYYSKHMDLRVEIDLGTQSKSKKGSQVKSSRRPALLLYVIDGDEKRLLARWPTTIGGWQDERLGNGAVVERFKSSDTGDFVWKNLYMAPRWLAPKSTPHDDVIRRNDKGRWYLDKEVLGPSFRSAYGLAMLILHKPYKYKEETRYADNGIRVHGTGNILSLPKGDSHGCHRLLGFQVLRLSAFLLRHRHHVRIGPEHVDYQRTFRKGGLAFPIKIDQRGYQFDLTPPVPIRVNP